MKGGVYRMLTFKWILFFLFARTCLRYGLYISASLHFRIYRYGNEVKRFLPHSGIFHFTSPYIYTPVEVKRFPVCAANSGSPA